MSSLPIDRDRYGQVLSNSHYNNSVEFDIEASTSYHAKSTTTTVAQEQESTWDIFFLLSVVAPLIFCCFAIFVCALNSIWKTRSKLETISRIPRPDQPEYTEYTIDLTTKVDSCVELSSVQGSSKEESVLL